MSSKKMQAIGNYVVLKKVDIETTTSGGLSLISLRQDEATVVSTGPLVDDCLGLAEGDRVKVLFEHGVDIKDDSGEEFHVANPENIVCRMP